MANIKFKKLIEDLENNTSQVLGTIKKNDSGTSAYAASAGYSSSAGQSGTALLAASATYATSAGKAGTALYATNAGSAATGGW